MSDPDHLKAFEIDSLYNHWLTRQSKGLTPLIILNSIPQHGVAKKKSEKAKGKRKIDYVHVNTDDEEVQSDAGAAGGNDERSGDDEETRKSTPPKIGPPSGKPKKTGSSTQEAGPSGTRQPGNKKDGKAAKQGPVEGESSRKAKLMTGDVSL